jgi:hypothetical protein
MSESRTPAHALSVAVFPVAVPLKCLANFEDNVGWRLAEWSTTSARWLSGMVTHEEIRRAVIYEKNY